MIILDSELDSSKPFFQEVIDEIKDFTKIIPSLEVIFYSKNTEENAKKLVDILQYPDFIEDRIYDLFLQNNLAFSWGHEDSEFVFIFIDDESFLTENKDALKGLIVHEAGHSVQRQRGFEIDLKNSMSFSLPFFTGLAEGIPSIEREKVVASLQEIAKVAVLVLKDLFINTELVRKGFAPQLCTYYENVLGFNNPDSGIQAPVFDISYTQGKPIDEESLDGFTQAMMFMLSLLPSWLPLVKDRKAGYLSRGLDLKHYLYDVFEKNIHVFSNEFHFIEDLYLTSFAFTREFHLEFYTAVFTLVLKFMSGENFDLQHLSNAVDLISKSTVIPADSKQPIIAPLLKAGDLIAEEYKVQEVYKVKLHEYLEEMVTPTEYKEWAEEKNDFEAKDLLLVPLYLVLNQARMATVNGVKYHLKMPLIHAALLILQILDLAQMEYYRPIRLLAKEYVSEDNPQVQTILVFKAEMMAKRQLFDGYPVDPEIVADLFDQLDVFSVPVTNEILTIIEQLFQLYDATIKKVSDEDELPEVLTLTFSAAFDKVSEESMEFAVPMVRTVLMMNGVKTALIRKIMDKFGGFMAMIMDQRDEEDEK
ncbi:MAG: hypothetical protein ACFFD4_23955 [Candidatus Odinarchaeota archaeon]